MLSAFYFPWYCDSSCSIWSSLVSTLSSDCLISLLFSRFSPLQTAEIVKIARVTLAGIVLVPLRFSIFIE